ncbi:conserved hypothetical protein [Tenacibaculum sp. 190524A02b]|uniref:YD repeat-containing protein n=1 Tax=Tenacibaculum vairaonense TaxID=3137860 RepID=A0ABP1F8A0_9FLAO
MIKNKQTRRTIAMFFLLNFLSTLFPYNVLYANNNGPNAPEAAAFEPVDATDMVNLATGDFTYVLPLLNVPSPEGGYPVTLNYHAGIAMDQEASWVGLGWNLNPGALNRGISGYPDDWSRATINEFFYDEGWVKDYYEFSIGATLPNGITLGVGASWGGNKGFGGSVSFGYGGIKTTMGIDPIRGMQGSAQVGMLNFSNSSVGLNLGGYSLGYDANSKEWSSDLNLNFMGVTISSSGISKGRNSIDFKSHSSEVLANDYDLEISRKGFSLDLKLFWIRLGSTRVKYSLFKMKDFKASGIGYAYNDFIESSSNTGELVDDNITMDTHTLSDNGIYHTFNGIAGDSRNVLVPSYDSYLANAQGYSAMLAPRLYRDVTLFSKNNYGNESAYILNRSNKSKTDLQLEKGIYFYDTGNKSSFLRVDKGEIKIPSYQGTFNSQIASTSYTEKTSTYSEDTIQTTGELIKNGFRKRDGNFIKTYTNYQIATDHGATYDFIDGMDKDERQRIVNLGAKEAIGGFKITTLDGKTYHYSLPVYNYEKIFKNFKNKSNENENFYEKYTTKPFATHWLLTAVTGPDYVDTNLNKKLDEEDYGYWVEFKYGKWSDAYGYRVPVEGYNSQYIGINNEERHSYTVGRKEIYYLDAISTRTHTALFVKSLREDNRSSLVRNFKSKYNGTSFQTTTNASSYPAKTAKKVSGDTKLFKESGDEYTCDNCGSYAGKGVKYNYIDYPINRSLKLDKVLLLKRGIASNILNNRDKGGDALGSKEKAYFNMNKGYNEMYGNLTSGPFPIVRIGEPLFTSPTLKKLEGYGIEYLNNVLDVNDFNFNHIKNSADKIIELNYDYALAKGSHNSANANKGKLTLGSVNFKGKYNSQILPPYVFGYNKKDITYDKNKIDSWGYHLEHPDAWNLNKITTPIGTVIDIEHETDVFKPINNTPIRFFKDMHFAADQEQNSGRLITVPNSNREFIIDAREDVGMKVGDRYTIKYLYGSSGNVIANPLGNNYNKEVSAEIIEKIQGNVAKYKARLTGAIPIQPAVTNFYGILLSYNINKDHNGGGIRTKSLSISEIGSEKKIKTVYKYENGVTSYIPYKQEYDVYLRDLITPPSVMYGKVIEEKYDNNNEFSGKIEYEFETLGDMQIEYGDVYNLYLGLRPIENRAYTHLKLEKVTSNATTNVNNNHQIYIGKGKYTVLDTQANLGRILSKKTYNKFNQGLNSVNYEYKQNLDNDGEIGVEQETFTTLFRRVTEPIPSNKYEKYYLSSLSKVTYPSTLSKVTNKSNGLNSITRFNQRDFLTGQVLEKEDENSTGKKIKTIIKPAHTISSYKTMGAKVDDENANRNMLTQVAAEYGYIYKENAWKPIGANITTWNDTWNYKFNDNTTGATNYTWRKHKTYTWNGEVNTDGTFINYLDNFDWGINNIQSDSWRKINEITKYNQFSKPLEVKDINSNYASTKMGDNYTKVIATSNAAYDDMYYSGAEYKDAKNASYFDGGVKSFSNSALSSTAHTGTGKVSVNANQNAFEVNVPARTERTGIKQRFKVSVWVKKNTDGSTPALKIKDGSSTANFNDAEDVVAGDWVMKQGYITIPTSGKTVAIYSSSSTVILDDFRLHPATSSMTSYVYNQWDEVTFITGANGLSTCYVYDDAGRLKETWIEVVDNPAAGIIGGFKKVSTNAYNYKRNQ